MNILIRAVVTVFIGLVGMFHRKKKQRQALLKADPELISTISKTSLTTRIWNKIRRKKSIPPPIPTTESSIIKKLPLTEEYLEASSLPPPSIPETPEPPPSEEPKKSLLSEKWQLSKLLTLRKSIMQSMDIEKQKRALHQGYHFLTGHVSSLRKPSPTRDILILRPAQTEESWELWKIISDKSATATAELNAPVLVDDHSSPLKSSSKVRLIIGVPTRDLIVIPLWISSEGNLQELVELELASRNLLRRGMAEGLKTIPLETKDGRVLVSILAPTAILSSATAPYLKHADQFEAAARLLPHEGKDLLIWQELGEICFGFFKNNQCAWFSGSGETFVNRTLLGLITRMSWQLEAESVIDHLPKTLRIIGSFSEEETSLLQSLLTTKTQWEHLPETQAPLLPSPPLDLPPAQARLERIDQEKQQRFKKIALIALAVYLFLLFIGAINLIIKESVLKHLNYQVSVQRTSVEKATKNIERWHEFRSAVDPSTYALDILATIANQIHGEKIRIITLTSADGHLQVTGEATDVAQAYHFIELIKKAPELQEYQWTSGQPKLAGKNSVRFELEGTQAHTKASTE